MQRSGAPGPSIISEDPSTIESDLRSYGMRVFGTHVAMYEMKHYNILVEDRFLCKLFSCMLLRPHHVNMKRVQWLGDQSEEAQIDVMLFGAYRRQLDRGEVPELVD